jgi:hypothetical protein
MLPHTFVAVSHQKVFGLSSSAITIALCSCNDTSAGSEEEAGINTHNGFAGFAFIVVFRVSVAITHSPFFYILFCQIIRFFLAQNQNV